MDDNENTDQDRIDRDTARAAERGRRADARATNDPLRPRDRQQDGGIPLPRDTQPAPQEAYSGMEHPSVPMPVTDQGWDNVVADAPGYRYVQSHWSDALEAAQTEQETLAAAATAEVERLHLGIEALTDQRDTWLRQREAHGLAAEAIADVRSRLRDQQREEGGRELAAAEQRAAKPRGRF